MTPDLLALVAVAVASFLGVALLVPLAMRVAVGYGVLAHPQAARLHRSPIPYLGGVAIVLTALGVSTFLPDWSVEAAVLMLGALLVGIVGLVDDVRNLSPWPRLATEVLAGTMAAAAGSRVHLFEGPLDWVITVAWLVIITNAFNLLDNMDGAAGVIATITSLSLLVAAALEGQWLVGGLAATLLGSCVGFLLFNWHPARVFMGDAGSLFLGFLLGATALKLRFSVGHGASLPAVALLMGPALFDTTLVVISRLRAGKPIYQGATDHTSHRLLRLGFSTRTVVLLLGGGAVVSVSLGVLVGTGHLPPLAITVAVAIVGGVLLRAALRLPEGPAPCLGLPNASYAFDVARSP